MKFSIRASDLSAVFALHKQMETPAYRRQSMPIIDMVSVKIDTINDDRDGAAIISMTNTEVAASFDVDIFRVSDDMGVGDGICLPAHVAPWLKSIPADAIVTIGIDMRKAAATLTHAGQTVTVYGADVRDFPVSSLNDTRLVDEGVPANQYIDMVKRALHATMSDDARPILTGLHLRFSPIDRGIVATDGFRLAIAGQARQKATIANVPKTFGKLLAGLEPNDGSAIRFSGEDSVIRFSGVSNDGDWTYGEAEFTVLSAIEAEIDFTQFNWATVSARCIDGRFPDYQMVVDAIPPRLTASFEVEELRRALRVIRPFNDSFQMHFDAARGVFTVSTQSGEWGDATGEVDAQIDGKLLSGARDIEGDDTITFDHRFISEMLAAMPSGRIEIRTGADIELDSEGKQTIAYRPALFIPAGSAVGYVEMVMPKTPTRGG